MKFEFEILPVGKAMGRGFRDLTGQRFGRLIADKCVGRTAGRHWVWSCTCDCGEQIQTRRSSLVNETRTSCGCAEDAFVTGQRIGELTLGTRDEGPGKLWNCACSCGGSASYHQSALLTGRRISCGNCVAVRAARGVALCSRCRETKPLAEFHDRSARPSGKSYSCAQCANTKTATAYRADVEVSRARRREYFARDPRGQVRLIENQKRNPAKHAAQMRVYNAVKRGRLVRPAVCSRCPETHRIEGHHDDYGKPLDVMWLCTACHRARHKELRALGIDPEASTRPERKVA